MSDLLGDNYYAAIGGVRLGMLLLGYTRSDEAVYDKDDDRIGTRVKMTLTGEASAATAAALKTAVDAIRSACLPGGQDVKIYGDGTLRDQILAGYCSEGPKCVVTYVDPTAGRTQGLSIAVDALLGSAEEEDPPEEGELVKGNYETTIRYDAQGLVTTSERGNLTAKGSGAAALAVAKKPAASTSYVITFEQTANHLDTEASYTWTKQQLAVVFPAAAIGDGEQTITTSVDYGGNRKVISYSYDYTGSGAAGYLTGRLAALAAAGGLVSSSYAETSHKQTRATLTAQVLASRDASSILEFSESVRVSRQTALLEVRTYPGAAPLIAQLAQAAWLVEQAGRAVGLGGYPSAAPTLYDEDQMSEAPDIQCSRISNVEMETSWRYAFLFVEYPTFIMPNSYATYGGTVTAE